MHVIALSHILLCVSVTHTIKGSEGWGLVSIPAHLALCAGLSMHQNSWVLEAVANGKPCPWRPWRTLASSWAPARRDDMALCSGKDAKINLANSFVFLGKVETWWAFFERNVSFCQNPNRTRHVLPASLRHWGNCLPERPLGWGSGRLAPRLASN